VIQSLLCLYKELYEDLRSWHSRRFGRFKQFSAFESPNPGGGIDEQGVKGRQVADSVNSHPASRSLPFAGSRRYLWRWKPSDTPAAGVATVIAGPEERDAITNLPDAIREHSGRTWMLGMALAILDRRELDRELFYCAALLHDFGLARPTNDHDFTLAGSKQACELAKAVGIEETRRKAIADGICVHPTVGITVPRDGAIGYYLHWGSMADIAGLRRSEVPKPIQNQIL
jgi:HD domain-containing protein